MNAEGKRDGFGYAVIDNCSAIFEGYWQNGTMHGQGRLTSKNGYYVGDFSTNQRQGFGVYKFRSGDYYEGEWLNGLRSGAGRLYTKIDDRIYEGKFKNNNRDGEGRILSGDGNKVIEKGTWRNDVKL